MQMPYNFQYLFFFFKQILIIFAICLFFSRHNSLESDVIKQNSFCAEVMLIIASIVHLGKSGLPQKAMTDDDYDRMMLCLQVIFIFIYLFI